MYRGTYSSGTTNIVMHYLRSRFLSYEALIGYMHALLFAPLVIDFNALLRDILSRTTKG